MFGLRDESVALLASVAAYLALGAAPAFAADAYVDDDAGSGIACTQAAPCGTIALGVAVATPGATIHVDGGSYLENVTLGSGQSLSGEEFTGDIEADRQLNPPTGVAVTVPAAGAGTISGMKLGAVNAATVILNGPATLSGNTFSGNKSTIEYDLRINGGAGASQVIGNTFTDPAPGISSEQIGLGVFGGATPLVRNNSLSNYLIAVDIQGDGSDPMVDRNTISGAYIGNFAGFGMRIFGDAQPTLTDNLIHNPGPTHPTYGAADAISITEGGVAGSPTGATFARNRIFGYAKGVFVGQTLGPVTFNGDTIANQTNPFRAIQVFNPTSTDVGDIEATNVTFYNAVVELASSDLVLDSSILAGSSSIVQGGSSTCTITNSRGSTMTPGGSGCQNFQTSADPMFLNAASEDFHLLAGSPMIDAGNPAAPVAPNLTDFDGNPRALPGLATCPETARRDIGADEFAGPPVALDCTPPDTVIDSGPSASTTETTPTFGFHATESGSTFECRFDGGAYGPCSGPGATHTPSAPLTEGGHSFEVRATDSSGNVDATAAGRLFTVNLTGPPPPPTADTTPPETTISKAPKAKVPAGKNGKAKITFVFGSSEAGASFECKLDKGGFRSCRSPFKRSVKAGRHVFAVRAKDAAGNIDATPAVRKWRVVVAAASQKR